MSALEREIRERLDQLTEILLKGSVPDYVAYRELVGRRQVLRELLDFIEDRKATDQGDLGDDD